MKVQNRRRIFVTFVTFVGLLLIGSLMFHQATVPATQAQSPVKVIFETDMTFDVDDAGAMAVLHALADNGEAEILGISYNEVQDAAPALDAMNTWYNRGYLPIGLYPGTLPNNGDASRYYHYLDDVGAMSYDLSDNVVSNSVDMYKTLLAAEADNSVTIISVGFLNNLYDLLQDSEGYNLADAKVKELVIMGGINNDGFNLVRHNTGSQARYVIQNWPGNIVMTYYGAPIETGDTLSSEPANNPIRESYRAWNTADGNPPFKPRSSWDQLAVYYGVRGLDGKFNRRTSGNFVHQGQTIATFNSTTLTYIEPSISDSAWENVLNQLMTQSPISATPTPTHTPAGPTPTPTHTPAVDPEVTGTIIGTTGYTTGWGGGPREVAVDGNTATFFDAPSADGGWVGYDFGTGNEKVITRLRYFPRSGFESRMVGGKFQGANTANFSDAVVLYTISGTPPLAYTEVTISNGNAFRYVRYLAPNGGWGNIAEEDFYGHNGSGPTPTNTPTATPSGPTATATAIPTNTPVPPTPTNTPVPPTNTPVPPTPTPAGSDPEVTGTIIGTNGAWCCGYTKDKAVDGNTGTYFDAPNANQDYAWVGYDFGSGNENVITKLRYYPRSSFASRMNGGRFQGANNADFSDAVDLHTISNTPPYAFTSVNISNGTAFRYVRYLAPAASWGNIAELDFYGHGGGGGPTPTNTPVPPTNTPVPPTNTPVPGNNLLLHYDFSNGSGTIVSDLSGNGNNGTLTNFSNTSAGAGSFNSSEGWVSGGGLSFLDDGTRSYVETDLALNSLNNSDFTIEYTANYAGASGWTPLIGSNAGSCCTAALYMGLDSGLSNNHVRLQGSTGNVGSQPWGSSSSTQHHLAWVFDDSTNQIELFIDGSSAGTSSISPSMNQTSEFRLGNTGWQSGEQWDGVIFGVAITKAKLAPGTFVLD